MFTKCSRGAPGVPGSSNPPPLSPLAHNYFAQRPLSTCHQAPISSNNWKVRTLQGQLKMIGNDQSWLSELGKSTGGFQLLLKFSNFWAMVGGAVGGGHGAKQMGNSNLLREIRNNSKYLAMIWCCHEELMVSSKRIVLRWYSNGFPLEWSFLKFWSFLVNSFKFPN